MLSPNHGGKRLAVGQMFMNIDCPGWVRRNAPSCGASSVLPFAEFQKNKAAEKPPQEHRTGGLRTACKNYNVAEFNPPVVPTYVLTAVPLRGNASARGLA